MLDFTQVLGTPTREQIREMNPNYTEFKFPQIKSHPWAKVILKKLLKYIMHFILFASMALFHFSSKCFSYYLRIYKILYKYLLVFNIYILRYKVFII